MMNTTMPEAFRQLATGVRILETAANYVKADEPLTQPAKHSEDQLDSERFFYSDELFWNDVMGSPDEYWGKMFHAYNIVLSEWVARVPGLYWKPESAALRQVNPAAIERQSEEWIQYNPGGKSGKVMGGIGTIRLAPSLDGSRLLCLTSSANASTGVPVLVSSEVLDKIGQLGSGSLEGRMFNHLIMRWQPMTNSWASQFPSIRGIPRGHFVLDDPDQIKPEMNAVAPTQFHPFSVMEYSNQNAELFDYVFATADTGDANHRQYLEEFFERYKNDFGRHGRYLLASDMYEPLWDADYNSPAELRNLDPGGKSQLELLEARVREHMLGKNTIETVLEELGSTTATEAELGRLSDEILINRALWLGGSTHVEKCSKFLAYVVGLGHEKFEELIEKLSHYRIRPV